MTSLRRTLNILGLPIVALFWGYAGYAALTDLATPDPMPVPPPVRISEGARPLEWAETDHVTEMELCKQKIAKLVVAVYDWQWGRAWAVGERRIRKGFIRYIARNGEIRTGTFTCSFDVEPAGNDFFID